MAAQVITKFKAETEQYNRKVKEAKNALEQFGIKGKGAGQALGQLDKLLGTSISSFGKLTAGVGAASAALKVAKDAFFKNELQLDEWGRTTEAAKGVYEGFLNALNNGDISGYLSNIQNIINAARSAYDALDELATFKAFNQVNEARAKAGYSEALERYKANPNAENKKALEQANKAVIANLQAEGKKAGKAYEESLKALFANANVSKAAQEGLRKIFESGSYTEYAKAKSGYQELGVVESAKKGYLGSTTWYNNKQVKDVDGHGYYVTGADGRAQRMTEEENKRYQIAKVLNQVNDTQISEVQRLGAEYHNLTQSVADQNRAFNRLAGNNLKPIVTPTKTTASSKGTGSITGKTDGLNFSSSPGLDISGLTGGSIDAIQAQLKDAQAVYEMAGDEAGRKYAKTLIDALKNELAYLQGDNPFMATITADFEKSIANLKLPEMPQLSIPKNVTKDWQAAANAIGQVGSALSSIEDPQAKVAGLIAQAIANVALSFAQAAAAPATTSTGVWGWIAAAASGAATMVATIASIKSATAGSFAQGGVIGGNSYYGDKLYARVNSGETILNQDQARRALDMMTPQSSGGSNTVSMSGEMIKIVLNNHLRAIGVSGDKLIGA